MNQEKLTAITAKEAVELTNKNALTLEGLTESISRNATNGINCIRLFDVMIPFDVMKHIINNGFTISQYDGLMGENIIRIGW